MDTELKHAVYAADTDAQYDARAKHLLGNKIILAHILVQTVDEFAGMNPNDVVSHIEGEPLISKVPVESGLTNVQKQQKGQRIVGLNTENLEACEGLIRFDIIFYVRMKDGISQVIVNIEMQKDEPAGYHILNRAVFYASRMISSQKERDFVHSDYNDIKRVFSIWVCMNMKENSMDYIHLTDEKLLGSYPWKGKIDLLNIILIGITNDIPAHEEKYELHRLLGTLFSVDIPADEKIEIIEKEYSIPADGKIREDVSEMCNLSQGILERGEARGEVRGKTRAESGFILNMYKKGYTLEQIADVAEKSIDEVKVIIEEEFVPV